MSKVFQFHKSLKQGQASEKKFLELFPNKLEHLDGKQADFRILKTSQTMELKSDMYDPAKTENMVMELYSYDLKPGGPFQSKAKGIDYFVYWYPLTKEVYAFKVNELVARLEELKNKLRVIEVRNVRHTTTCYLVPRTLLTDLAINLETIL